MGRRLERHVNWDLAERIEANGPIKKERRFKTIKQPRAANTYRGARRNEASRITSEARRHERDRRREAIRGDQENNG